jgi:hypothetical protein
MVLRVFMGEKVSNTIERKRRSTFITTARPRTNVKDEDATAEGRKPGLEDAKELRNELIAAQLKFMKTMEIPAEKQVSILKKALHHTNLMVAITKSGDPEEAKINEFLMEAEKNQDQEIEMLVKKNTETKGTISKEDLAEFAKAVLRIQEEAKKGMAERNKSPHHNCLPRHRKNLTD